jgi:hypothetical protein
MKGRQLLRQCNRRQTTSDGGGYVAGCGDSTLLKCRNPKTLNPKCSPQERRGAPFSDDMRKEVTAFYFRNYQNHFSTPVMRDIWASVPQIMQWWATLPGPTLWYLRFWVSLQQWSINDSL